MGSMGTWNAPIETDFDGAMASSKPRWDVDGKTFRSRRSAGGDPTSAVGATAARRHESASASAAVGDSPITDVGESGTWDAQLRWRIELPAFHTVYENDMASIQQRAEMSVGEKEIGSRPNFIDNGKGWLSTTLESFGM